MIDQIILIPDVALQQTLLGTKDSLGSFPDLASTSIRNTEETECCDSAALIMKQIVQLLKIIFPICAIDCQGDGGRKECYPILYSPLMQDFTFVADPGLHSGDIFKYLGAARARTRRFLRTCNLTTYFMCLLSALVI